MADLMDSLGQRWQAMLEAEIGTCDLSDRSPASSDLLQAKIDILRQSVDQWNPHHPTKAEAIEKWTALLDSRQEVLDDLRRRPDPDVEEMLAVQLDQADGFLNGSMHRARGEAQARARAASVMRDHSPEPAATQIQPG